MQPAPRIHALVLLAAGIVAPGCASPAGPARPILSEATCPDGSRWVGRPCGTPEQRAVAPASRSAGDAAPPCGVPSGMAVRAPAEAMSSRLCVRLRAPSGAAPAEPATVVLVWYRPEERAKFQGRLPPPELLDAVFERGRVIPGASLASGAADLVLDYPGGDAVVLAIADFRHAFWPTMFGAGEGNLVGVSAVAEAVTPTARRAEVVLEAVPARPPRPEACTGERFELVRVDAPEVAGTVGNDTARRMCAWLPPSYRTAPARRYPVVYLLPGFASGDAAYLVGNQSLRDKADALARDGGPEVILVGVDTSTRHGSTYFTDSAAGGRWDAFVRDRMVPEIDRRLRTRAEPRSRALVGHSTGGFNAVSLAIRHPDLFTIVGASAPDGLDFEHWLVGDDGRVRPRWLAWTRLEAFVGGMGQILSYAAAWSTAAPPAPEAFPFDLETGVLSAESWPRWRAESPLRMLDDPARLATLKRVLGGRIYLTVGRRDEFGLAEPTQRFAARLAELGVAHELVVTQGGHSSDQQVGLEASLAFATRALAGAPKPAKR